MRHRGNRLAWLRVICVTLLAFLILAPRASADQGGHPVTARVVRITLHVRVERPDATVCRDLSDTSSIVVPDSLDVWRFMQSDRYLAHFAEDHVARVGGNTRRLEFVLLTTPAEADFEVRIQGPLNGSLRNFRCHKSPADDHVRVRWNLSDSSGVRVRPGNYLFIIEAHASPGRGMDTGVIHVIP